MNFNKLITIVFLTALFAINSAGAQPLEIYSAAELQIALEKLNTLGSLLYIAAHPDDEKTSLLLFGSAPPHNNGWVTNTRSGPKSGGRSYNGYCRFIEY